LCYFIQTLVEVSDAILKLQQNLVFNQNGETLQGLIIDLRDNLGGPLSAALDLAALFLPKGSYYYKYCWLSFSMAT
jgi:C-terminal processing protease CtpA/Prc